MGCWNDRTFFKESLDFSLFEKLETPIAFALPVVRSFSIAF